MLIVADMRPSIAATGEPLAAVDSLEHIVAAKLAAACKFVEGKPSGIVVAEGLVDKQLAGQDRQVVEGIEGRLLEVLEPSTGVRIAEVHTSEEPS